MNFRFDFVHALGVRRLPGARKNPAPNDVLEGRVAPRREYCTVVGVRDRTASWREISASCGGVLTIARRYLLGHTRQGFPVGPLRTRCRTAASKAPCGADVGSPGKKSAVVEQNLTGIAGFRSALSCDRFQNCHLFTQSFGRNCSHFLYLFLNCLFLLDTHVLLNMC